MNDGVGGGLLLVNPLRPCYAFCCWPSHGLLQLLRMPVVNIDIHRMLIMAKQALVLRVFVVTMRPGVTLGSSITLKTHRQVGLVLAVLIGSHGILARLDAVQEFKICSFHSLIPVGSMILRITTQSAV